VNDVGRIRILSLYSGSTGNAFLISAPSGTILIDAGKSARRLCNEIKNAGLNPEDIRAIFVTHEHTDHISALPVFLKKHPVPVHIQQGCLYKLENETQISHCLISHPPIFEEEICGMRVTSFPTPHDSHASVGYRIEIPLGDRVFRIGYATDIGYVSKDVEAGLLGCDAVILESNHDSELLMLGPYPYELKLRVASNHGHLSNIDCADFAAKLCASGTKHLMLAHLSQENNMPDIAYDACFGAIADENITLCIARPEEITELTLED